MLKLTDHKPRLLGTAILLSALISPTLSFAQSASATEGSNHHDDLELSRQETKGILGGAALGAVVAGPPGAILSAAFGGVIANYRYTRAQNRLLENSLEQSQQQLLSIIREQELLQQKYQLSLEENDALGFLATSFLPEPKQEYCCTDSSLEIHFKSNSSQVEKHYLSQLEAISTLAKNTNNPVVEITGYADQRGTNQENMLLSQKRVNTIKSLLQTFGVDELIMQGNAYGESQLVSFDNSTEGNFFDRKVNINIRSRGNDLLTQNP